jgi:hypothetical protein
MARKFFLSGHLFPSRHFDLPNTPRTGIKNVKFQSVVTFPNAKNGEIRDITPSEITQRLGTMQIGGGVITRTSFLSVADGITAANRVLLEKPKARVPLGETTLSSCTVGPL